MASLQPQRHATRYAGAPRGTPACRNKVCRCTKKNAGVPKSMLVYRTVRRCNAQYAGVPHGTLVYRTVRWCTARYAGVTHSTLVYRMVRWCTARYAGVPHGTLVYRTVRWCTKKYAGVLHGTLVYHNRHERICLLSSSSGKPFAHTTYTVVHLQDILSYGPCVVVLHCISSTGHVNTSLAAHIHILNCKLGAEICSM